MIERLRKIDIEESGTYEERSSGNTKADHNRRHHPRSERNIDLRQFNSCQTRSRMNRNECYADVLKDYDAGLAQ